MTIDYCDVTSTYVSHSTASVSHRYPCAAKATGECVDNTSITLMCASEGHVAPATEAGRAIRSDSASRNVVIRLIRHWRELECGPVSRVDWSAHHSDTDVGRDKRTRPHLISANYEQTLFIATRRRRAVHFQPKWFMIPVCLITAIVIKHRSLCTQRIRKFQRICKMSSVKNYAVKFTVCTKYTLLSQTILEIGIITFWHLTKGCMGKKRLRISCMASSTKPLSIIACIC